MGETELGDGAEHGDEVALLVGWADLNQLGGPVGLPSPPALVAASIYTTDNQPIGALTTNSSSEFAVDVKFVGWEGEGEY